MQTCKSCSDKGSLRAERTPIFFSSILWASCHWERSGSRTPRHDISKYRYLMREILKVRKVGGTLVVTLTQAIIEEVQVGEGDRVLIEALPPKRILISKEGKKCPQQDELNLNSKLCKPRKKRSNQILSGKATNIGVECLASLG